MTAYYNEIDPGAAAWLRELIKAGVIADGHVDERDIRDVRPSDLGGYTQCHFFAGIGVWSYALRLAGWPDDHAVWTGSCPCQPFSAAGKGAGFADERHLWPAWFHLIEQRGPGVIFGEQVASPDGLVWFELVSSDLERTGYAVAPNDICAAGVGAPHIRQRLWFVADAVREPGERRAGSFLGAQAPKHSARSKHGRESHGSADDGEAGSLAHTAPGGRPWLSGSQQTRAPEYREAFELADATNERCGESRADSGWLAQGDLPQRLATGFVPGGHVNGFWQNADWIYCRDGKYRPVEPGSFPLAHGAPARVGRLRGYGNAIVAPLAAEFIRAYMSINS